VVTKLFPRLPGKQFLYTGARVKPPREALEKFYLMGLPQNQPRTAGSGFGESFEKNRLTTGF
jgi:hypothetical protein